MATIFVDIAYNGVLFSNLALEDFGGFPPCFSLFQIGRLRRVATVLAARAVGLEVASLYFDSVFYAPAGCGKPGSH
jgi:hypothetical protein